MGADLFEPFRGLLLVLLVGVLCMGLATLLLPKGFFGPKRWSRDDLKPYRLEKSVMNSSEARLYAALRKALPPHCGISVKMRLSDLFAIKTSDRSKRQSAFNRVKSRHVDFVVHDRRGRPLCAVELDGPMHRKFSSRRADAFKDQIFERVGLPLFRVVVDTDYQTAAMEIRERL